jgi:sugar phosphate isomerase/epimerase
MRIGSTTLPLAGWMADVQQPEASRRHRLAAIRQLVEQYGCGAIELTLDLGALFPQVFDAQFYQAVARLQQELGFACTAHLPFLWLDLSSPNERMRQASLACVQHALALARPMEVDAFVLHLWGATTMQIAQVLEQPTQREAILSAILAQAERSLVALAKELDPQRLAVENLEAPAFERVLPLVERCGASICLDVGHLAWHGGGELEFVTRHADRIRVVHLHDARRLPGDAGLQVRDHLALGDGEIDYGAFLQALKTLGYRGVVTLEVNTRAELERSLARARASL